jgi:DNA modification methylase
VTAVVLRGDARRLPLPDECVDLICCSPPYFGLRSYVDNGEHYDGQIGSESTPREWLAALAECTAEWVRVLKPSGSIFVNLGDKYAGAGPDRRHTQPLTDGEATVPQRPAPEVEFRRSIQFGTPQKSLMGLPWRYALACMDDLGLILRRDIIWSKPNGLPESVTDRCRSSHEYLFHFTRQPRYYAAVDEIREAYSPNGESFVRMKSQWREDRRKHLDVDATRGNGHSGLASQAQNPLGKLPGSVWDIPSQPLTVPAALGVDHFAAFPMELPRRCVLGWSPPGVCTACGEGRRPVTETAHFRPRGNSVIGGQKGTAPAFNRWGGSPVLSTEATITGYACACPQPDAPTRPSVVLDPFGGTGTTALVAAAYGRTGISVDMSGDYSRLARWRTTDPGERAKAMMVAKPPPVPDGQVSLFDDFEAV